MQNEPCAGVSTPVVRISGLTHRFGDMVALDGAGIELPAGSDTVVIGPDGVGKSTLLSIIAGARIIQGGTVEVLGADMRRAVSRTRVANRIAFMPQGLGKNLYPSLSVSENIEFFASLYSTSPIERAQRRDTLLHATGLDPFPDRPAGNLSGGMKQKLSLCCALVHDPDLLILDEPTTGIDPLSRRQFWQLIDGIRAARPGMTLVVATAYMEEARRFSRLIAMDAGRILADGPLAETLSRAGADKIEAAFVALRGRKSTMDLKSLDIPSRPTFDGGPAIVATGLTRRFGDFAAVDDVSFRIERGEIFGFLGSNGCGKSTTMKMLTGLLPATSGRAELLGKPVDASDLAIRRRVGYMSQSFSLYTELSVRANLALHARLYHLDPIQRDRKISAALTRFGLDNVPDSLPNSLPLGVRQRLQLAVACLHDPEVLILDEPTSGVDPEARDSFWRILVDLSRRDGVTIFISTHFLEEAERCDRVSFMHAGKVLAVGRPAELRANEQTETLEAAFIACLERHAGATKSAAPLGVAVPVASAAIQLHEDGGLRRWLTWVGAFAAREWREVLRDRVRLSFGVLGPLVLMVTFARGISFDIEALPFSVLDRDRSAQSLALTLELSGSRYFAERRPALTSTDVDRRLQSGEAALVVEIPPGFGRELLRGHKPEISLWLDGANPARANTARGYAEGIARSFVAGFARSETELDQSPAVSVEPRFLYNQDFRSVFAMTPGVIMFLVMMIMAMMTALGVVRERESGSIVNLAVSPASTSSFLFGKFLPYVVIGAVTFAAMLVIATVGLGLTIKGSFAALILGGLLYVVTATTFGVLVSTLVRSQVAAILACAVMTMMPALNFSGFLQPISNLSPEARIIGLAFPSSWFQTISTGVFSKGLPFDAFLTAFVALAAFPFVYLLIASRLLQKQEP